MNDTVLLIICIILLCACLVLLAALLLQKKRQTNGISPETLKRLEENTEAAARLADYNARMAESLSRSTEQRLSNIQGRLSEDFKYIVDANAQNLERIRRTVDEKLTSSIDGKLTDSYARICERLEKMYQSVGEMKSISDGVSDIRRVFTNVKLRGTWGETQLSTLLEQMLSPEQYRASVKLNPLDNTLVDFAVLIPSREGDTVYLPIDSKFPIEEYQRLCECSEQGDREGADRALKNLEKAVKLQADSIAKKYVLPPVTTDFAIMYLPLEGLYAEILKMPSLSDFLHSRRIVACGPTNLGALLSTLQTGFRTAAIEKRSGELRQMLELFRADFIKFADLLDKTRKKLQEATDSVEGAVRKTNTIGRRLDTFRAIESPDTPPTDDAF